MAFALARSFSSSRDKFELISESELFSRASAAKLAEKRALLARKSKYLPLTLSESAPYPGYWVMAFGSVDWHSPQSERLRQ